MDSGDFHKLVSNVILQEVYQLLNAPTGQSLPIIKVEDLNNGQFYHIFNLYLLLA